MYAIATSQLMIHLLSDLKVLDEHQGRISLNGGPLWPDATVDQARAWSLVRNLIKKYNDEPEPSVGACEAALTKFLAVNKRCESFEVKSSSWLDDLLLGELRKELNSYWFTDAHGSSVCDNYVELVSRGGVGKGSAVDSREPDFYTKLFDSRLACTNQGLMDTWRQTVCLNPHWRNAETVRQIRYGSRIVAGNKLSFVNKNVDTARCISKEPVINMWFQKGLGEKLSDRTKHLYGIDLETQPLYNGKLAEYGSAYGRFATIDLESASDSLGLRMLEQVLPKQWYNLLLKLRSPICVLPKGRCVLNMAGTMGNGFTFPLQTALFTCIVSAVYRLIGVPLKNGADLNGSVACADFRNLDTSRKVPRLFGVFGDDIIVVTEAYSWVKRLLELLGFVLNEQKTFVEGPFRESCGYDWFQGQPCRAVYLKRLRTAQDIYVAINTLNRWSAMTKLYLPATVGYLRSAVTTTAPRVPCDEDDTAGIHVPSDLAQGTRRGVFGIWKYRKDAPVPVTVSLVGEGITARVIRRTRDLSIFDDRKINHGGAHIAFLAGYIRGNVEKTTLTCEGKITVRQQSVTYVTKHMTTPCWDYDPKFIIMDASRPRRSEYFDFAAWSAAVRLNLS